MATLEENINQAIADFDDIEKAIEEKGVDVPAGTDTKEYGNLIRRIPNGVDVDLFYNPESENAQSGIAVSEALAGLPIKYVVSPDANGNTVFLRSLESGTYVLNGAFKPYDGNNTVCRFSSDLLVNVVKGTLNKVPTSHIQIFYPVHNVVQFVDVTDTSYKRTDIKLNDLAKMETVEEMIAAAQNAYSNALKGNASGEVVRIDDVSPIEHKVKAKVSGKNLFDMSRFTTTNQTSLPKIVEVGENYVILNCPVGSYGHAPTEVKLATFCSKCEVGKTYVLTASSPSQHQYLYLDGANTTWHFGTARVVSEAMLNSFVVLYGYNMEQESETKECTISNIQLEAGDTATEYEPYIDPTTVTVTRCGKNLIKYPFTMFECSNDELTAIDNGDGGVILNGTVTKDTFINIGRYQIPSDESIFSTSTHGFISNKYNASVWTSYDSNNNVVFVFVKAGTTLNSVLFYPQIEVGYVSTDFEKGTTPETYTPSADGTCEINSLSPTMTLLTDTEGVNIEIEYNQDNNAFADNVKIDLRELDNVTAELAAQMGDTETALDSIIAIQNSLIGGENV